MTTIALTAFNKDRPMEAISITVTASFKKEILFSEEEEITLELKRELAAMVERKFAKQNIFISSENRS